MADVAEKSLDDFFAKRDKKKKKEKGKAKETGTGTGAGPTSAVIKKTKREKEKFPRSENQDSQMEKVTDSYNFLRVKYCPPLL